MDFRSKRHERGSNWTDPEIVELLQLWSDDSVQVELESSLRNQRVFDRIACVLREKGVYRTGDQCREKIKKMKLEYRRIKDNHKMRSWKFYDVMDRVLANRPAVTYSSLGGAVVAQQMFHSPGGGGGCGGGGGPDSYLQVVSSGGCFGPVSAGGFLFGNPPRSSDLLLDVKCENVEDVMVNSGTAPPAMYYGSADDPETDEQSVLEPEEALGRGQGLASARISPAGFSALNMAVPTAAATAKATGSHLQESVVQPRKEDNGRPGNEARQRKRRRAGKGAGHCGVAGCGGQGQGQSLDKALASFFSWQQVAEERLLSLEEARLESETRAEERREQREELRAELDRQHELRLLTVFAGALAAVRQGGPAAKDTSPATPNAPAASSFSSPTPPEAQTVQSTSSAVKPKPTAATASPAKAGDSAENLLVNPRAARASAPSAFLSSRGNYLRQHQGLLQEGFAQYHADKYHHEDNPNGVVNMGTSENKLCFDLLHKRLTQPDMQLMDPQLLNYPDWKGYAFLRKEVASFLTNYCGSQRPLNADNVVVINGCGSLFSAIAAVICDPEDAILIPSPFYGVISEDVSFYSGVRLFHVALVDQAVEEGGRPFHLSVSALEEALSTAKQEGVIIRAVILVNPHNPLAQVYTPEEMNGFLEFAKRHELHAIVDEVYMLTVFEESFTFRSVLSRDSLPDPQRTHVMWGLSKDFAMAGIRVGTLYTENRDLMEALEQLASFHGVPGPTQHMVAQLLQDREWIDKTFLPENHARMRAAHGLVTGELRRLGIPYLHHPVGFYVWANFRKFLVEASFAEELSLWRTFLRHKVVLSCGQAFSCPTPGWFRIVFTDQQRHLELGMKRMRDALQEIKANTPGPYDSGRVEESAQETVKQANEDPAETGNAAAAAVSSAPSSLGKPFREEMEKGEAEAEEGPVREESLDSLIGVLQRQMRSSDWLEKNTPELSEGEDPEVLEVFKELLQRVRK